MVHKHSLSTTESQDTVSPGAASTTAHSDDGSSAASPSAEPGSKAQRCFTISVGAGRRRVQAKPHTLGNDQESVYALSAILSSLPIVRDAWWSPHRWTNDSRAEESKWISAIAVVVDIDCKSPPSGKSTKSEKADFPPNLLSLLTTNDNPIPGSMIHTTPHGLRVVFLLERVCDDEEAWKRMADTAIGQIKVYLQSCPNLFSPEGSELLVDDPASRDRKRCFFRPRSWVDGCKRDSRVHVLRREPYRTTELDIPVATVKKAAPGPTSPTFKNAVTRYNKDHPHEWPTSPSDCPVCEHHGCFHALSERKDRWFCFSTDHRGCGHKTEKGHYGDALDLDAFQASRSQKAHLIAEGYLLQSNNHASQSKRGRSRLIEIAVPGVHDLEDGTSREVQEAEFSSSVVEALPSGTVYRRGGVLGDLRGADGLREFVGAELATIRNLVSEQCRLHKGRLAFTENGPKFAKAWQACTKDRAGLIIDAGLRSPHIPEIKRIVPFPVFAGDNLQLLGPGWHPDHATYVDLAGDWGRINAKKGMTIEEARSVLLDLVIDFPFEDDASRENFFGLLLTPILRPAIDANVPLHLVEAPQDRTGKSKLIEVVFGRAVLGSPTPSIQLGSKDEEINKQITAMLLAGRSVLNADNIGNHLDSSSLASLLTSRLWSGRILGASKIVTLPNETTLIASGNHVTASSEIAKRIVLIRMVPETDRPDLRTDFQHPDICGFVRKNRSQILRTLIAMVEIWRLAGGRPAKQPFGGFERWGGLVGGVLAHFGFTSWMGNREDWLRRIAPTETAKDILVRRWAKSHRVEVTPTELLPIVKEAQILPHVFKRDPDGSAAALGRFLAGMTDRSFGGHIVRSRPVGSGKLYFLEFIG